MRELGDARDVDERPDRVRRDREGDHLRPLRQLPLEVVEVEPALVVDVHEADLDPEVVLELEPRRDVRVVVEPRHEHLVAARELARQRSASARS